jgi:hypothetical protein
MELGAGGPFFPLLFGFLINCIIVESYDARGCGSDANCIWLASYLVVWLLFGPTWNVC